MVIPLLAALLLAAGATAEAPAISADDLARLGNALAAEIAKTSKGVKGPALARVERAAGPVVAAAGLKVRLHLLDDARMAAFDIPGGHVYVTTALVDACDEAELRAVLAHQLAHVRHGDTAKLIAAAYDADLLHSMLDGNAPDVLAGVAANVAASGALVRHGEGVEMAADHAMSGLGGDPSVLAAFMKKLATPSVKRSAEAREWKAKVSRYQLTHPSSRRRLRALLPTGQAATSSSSSPTSPPS